MSKSGDLPLKFGDSQKGRTPSLRTVELKDPLKGPLRGSQEDCISIGPLKPLLEVFGLGQQVNVENFNIFIEKY